MTATAGFVDAGGRLWVRRDAPSRRRRTTPVLAIHGVPDDGSTFDALAAELSTDRVVIRPDLPGLGRSDPSARYDAASVAARMADLAARGVKDLPGDGRIDVVGHDVGGVTALALSAARPDLVRRLVVLNAPYRTVLLHRAPHLPLFAVPWVPELLLGASRSWFGPAMIRAAWRSHTPIPLSLQEVSRRYGDPARTRAMLGYHRAAARSEPIGDVAVQRALLVWGADDPVLTMPVAAAAFVDLQRGTPDSTQVNVPGAGHWPHLAAHTATLSAITEFLRAP